MTGWEVAAALLTAVGLASLGWLAVGWLVSPGRPERDVKVYAVLRAAGDGEELEQAARRLRWLESGSGGLSIVIADDGLTDIMICLPVLMCLRCAVWGNRIRKLC